MAKLGIRLNTSNGGLSQINGWEFNSFTVLRGFPYATNSSEGLCKLCGGLDNGRKINSIIFPACYLLEAENSKLGPPCFIKPNYLVFYNKDRII